MLTLDLLGRSSRFRPAGPAGLLWAAWLLLALAACGKHPTRPPADRPMPDFALVDQNPSSTTAGQPVSPRQSLGKISAWYFGHAT